MTSREYKVDYSTPRLLLEQLATDPYFMTQGRRNDDLVNWFLACLLLRPGQTLQYYDDAFTELIDGLDLQQVTDIETWEIDYHDKLRMLFEHYGHLTEPVSIIRLWIPVDYQQPDYSGGSMSLAI